MGALARRLFGLSDVEASFARRGFVAADDATRERLEAVGRAFLHGYHARLGDARPVALTQALEALPADDRGFAVEGAAMAAALLDCLTPWPTGHVAALLDAFAAEHVYMIHVGIGWAWARLGRRPAAQRRACDPLLGWLALDGYGFHEGYFHWPRYAAGARPRRLVGYERRAFDQGLGRSLWFVCGGSIEPLAAAIGALDGARHDDLWSGVGLAATYAGGVGDVTLGRLRDRAAGHEAALAQGAAFAAKARLRAGLPTPHLERACRVLAGVSASAAAAATDRALDGLGPTGPIRRSRGASAQRNHDDDADAPAFERWRQRIRTQLCPAAESGGGDARELGSTART